MKTLRRDAVLVHERLLDAVETLVQQKGVDFSFPELAQAANVSSATVYRHFENLEDLRNHYTMRVVDRLVGGMEELHEKIDGIDLFLETCRVWISASASGALVAARYRSTEGLLERQAQGRPHIVRLEACLTAALGQLVELDVIPPQDLSVAALMWNAIFDERVLIDLLQVLGWTLDQVIDHLTATLMMSLGAHREVARRIVSAGPVNRAAHGVSE